MIDDDTYEIDDNIYEMMAKVLNGIGYCADWTWMPNKYDDDKHITLHNVIGEKQEFIPLCPHYNGNNKKVLKVAVKQITTLEQWLIRYHFDLWLKYSNPAYFGEDEDLLSIVQQVVVNAFEELLQRETH